MPMNEIRFLSKNKFKIEEVSEIMTGSSLTVIPINRKISEIQSNDVEELLHDKCMKAFKMIGKPLFVEHTGLEISALNGFPSGLTQLFWDTVKADKLSAMIGYQKDNKVVAKTHIGYCDGKKIHFFSGEISGIIPKKPRGSRDFQWDCVFQPDGHALTFSEMSSTQKNAISMRKLALEKLRSHLEAEYAS